MRTVKEDEWLAYLAKSKQKKLLPDAAVDPLTQVIVDAGVPKGTKRKKKVESTRTYIKIPRRGDDS
ncbi:hypothetical protein A2U01_0095856, partial [Trifolium medium]|nr:hypothetical protein [Trifolium medium]